MHPIQEYDERDIEVASGGRSAAGASIYSKPVLALYDVTVLGFSNTFIWTCPTRLIVEHYNKHISNRHLDVGVGTGYFLDLCTFPTPTPFLTLMDLNPNSLAAAARRVRRYQPTTLLADVTAPVRASMAPFDSIGIGYLLHCLPGPMHHKAAAIGHLAALLNPGGMLFGTTILGQGVRHGPLARIALRHYNQHGVFSNMDDSAQTLTDTLTRHFGAVSVHVVGCVAFFSARL